MEGKPCCLAGDAKQRTRGCKRFRTKKTKETDAIFENVAAVKAASRGDPETLEISADTKAKVAIGDYSRGEKSRTGSDGKPAQNVF